MATNENTASWNVQTESLYRVSAQLNLPYSASFPTIVRTKWNKITGTVFYGRQASIITKSIGNYINTYEYFNTTGRKENNLNFRYATRSIPTQTFFLNGYPSYYIPTRSVNIRNIFACRFNSPGSSETSKRGGLDIESEEYSSYNSINLRNLSVRSSLNDDSQMPTNLSSSSTYTLHKVNKNTQYIINSSFQISTKSDNGFIQHNIPYHVDQTKWLSSTLGRTQDYRPLLIQYNRQTGSDYYYTAILPGTGSNLTQSWASDYFTVYGYNTWNQVRASENTKSRLLRNNSYIALYKKDTTSEGSGSRVQPSYLLGTGSFDTSSEGVYLFKEPAVQFTNESITYDIYEGEEKILSLSEDIFNDIFLNTELNNAYNIQTTHNLADLQYIENIPNKRFIKRINKQIFPDPKNAGLSRANSRENFIFSWRDDIVKQSGANVVPNFNNSRGFTTKEHIQTYFTGLSDYLTYSIWPLDFYYNSSSQNYTVGSGQRQTTHTIVGELMRGAHMEEIIKVNVVRASSPFVSYTGLLHNSASTPNVSTVRGIMAAVSGSLPWTAYISASSYPFADTNAIYSKEIKNKFKEYSIIPEFNISTFINSSTFPILKSTIYDNSFSFVNTGSYNIFSSSKSVKLDNIKTLTFDINSVIRMTPYKGFYPSEKVLEITNILSKSLASVNYFNSISVTDNSMALAHIVGMPFFIPGVLNNSIKAGMPMNYTMISDLLAIDPVYSFLIVDFYDLWEPSKFAKNKKIYINEITESINTAQYTNNLSNFLDEIRYTFCKNNSLNYFNSLNEDKFKIFTSGTAYATDIEVVAGKVDKLSTLTNYNWIGGVNYIGRKSFARLSTAEVFLNQPIWYQDDITESFSQNGLSTTRLSFTPTETRKYTLDEILANLTVEHRINKITSSAITIMQDPYILAQSYTSSLMQTVTSSFNIFNKQTDVNDNISWNISSKWEFPFLAMTGAILNIEGDSGRIVDSPTGSYIGGLWHDFCDVPKPDQGLFISLTDVEYYSGSTAVKTASLADQVGFTKGIKKRIGELNDNKEISELLCIIPVSVKDNTFFKLPITTELYTDNKKYFKKFICPPKLDYVNNQVDPVVIFFQEVSDIWSKSDLSLIYQNLLPQNGLSFKEKNNIYSVTDPSIINILKNQEIKFMIFKCKMRSHTNKDNIVGYNYVYDYCSLLEMCQIDISISEEKVS